MNDDSKEKQKIISFRDLKAWQEAHKLTLLIYKATKQFPKEEIYCLVSQLRRAVISITSNIAEGFSRQSSKEKIHFYSFANGSLVEIQSQILISKDLGYIDQDIFNVLYGETILVQKLINGLIKSLKKHNT